MKALWIIAVFGLALACQSEARAQLLPEIKSKLIEDLATSQIVPPPGAPHKWSDEDKARFSAAAQEQKKREAKVAYHVELHAKTTDALDRALVISGVEQGPEDQCFSNPDPVTLLVRRHSTTGIWLVVKLIGADYEGYHTAFLSFPGKPAQICLPDGIVLGQLPFFLEDATSDEFVRSRYGRALYTEVGSESIIGGLFSSKKPILASQWIVMSQGLRSRDPWGSKRDRDGAPANVVEFESFLSRIGANRGSLGLTTLFGRTAVRYVGVRIRSIPPRAELLVDGHPTQFSTDGSTWLASVKFEGAVLKLGSSSMPIRNCRITALPGRITAEFECRLPAK